MQPEMMFIPAVDHTRLVKKRVAAYARVSVDKKAMLNSLITQKEIFGMEITSNPDYELVGIYSDYALSGAREDRPGMEQMLADCRAGKIDLIITKSVSRFARNVVFLLSTLRELKTLPNASGGIGVDVYFEENHLHSLSKDGEMLISLFSIIAEAESKSNSDNQRWRIKKLFERGIPSYGYMLGYRLQGDHLEIVPEEAKVVEQIFSDYLSGMGITKIADRLNESNAPTLLGKAKWNKNTVAKILRNEKYAGNLLLHKRVRESYRSPYSIKNPNTTVDMVEVEGSHEPIIEPEMFNAVQKEIERRSKLFLNTSKSGLADKEQHPRYFTGKLQCGKCGSLYSYKIKHRGEKSEKAVWKCSANYRYGGHSCKSKQVPQDILVNLAKEVLREVTGGEVKGDLELNEAIEAHLDCIIVSGDRELTFRLKSGEEIAKAWQYPSRSKSWTPEMREQARAYAQKRHINNEEKGEKQCNL